MREKLTKSLLRVSLLGLVLAAPSTAQELIYPVDVVATAEGQLFVADRHLPGVWKIEDGKLSVYYQGSKQFKTPLNAVRCLALDADGRLLAGDSATREIYRFDDEGKPQPLTGGLVGIPMGLAVGKGGEIYVADLEPHLIWKIPAAGGQPAEFAKVTAPSGLFMDSEQRLWAVSRGGNHLVRIAADGSVETVVQGRPFNYPHAVEIDSAGNIYVSDGYEKAIWKVTGGQAQKWVSGPPLTGPIGMATLGDQLLVVDPRAKAVFQIDGDGKVTKMPLAN